MNKHIIIGKSLLLGVLQIIYWKDNSKSGNTISAPHSHIQNILQIITQIELEA